MPIYDVEHSYPLTTAQKTSIAEQITKIHSTAFLTPSLFVHVTFTSRDASSGNYFLAGKPKTTSTNRIIGMVRTGSGRSKADFDKLAEQIEDAWYETVDGGSRKKEDQKNGDKKNGGSNGTKDEETQTEKNARKLMIVAFYAMVGAREDGLVIPAAGEEAAWYAEMKPEFQRRADTGSEEWKDLLEEVESREDLKKAYGA